jgi:DNA replication protein
MSTLPNSWAEHLDDAILVNGKTTIPNLLLDYQAELGLSDREVLVIINLIRLPSLHPVPVSLTDYIMEKMRLDRSEARYLLFQLDSKGCLASVKDPNSSRMTGVSLTPLYDRLMHLYGRDMVNPPGPKALPKINNLVKLFEQAFPRGLTPWEYEMMVKWQEEDNWPEEIVAEALKIAVLRRKLNFTYIDRILYNWQINQLDTLAKIKEYDANFRASRTRGQARKNTPKDMAAAAKGDSKALERKKRYEDIYE